MRTRTRTLAVGKFKTLLLFEAIIFVTLLFGTAAFANVEVAFLSAFFVIAASGYAHKKMVKERLKNGHYADDDRDPLEKIDDPHGLFDDEDINNAPAEELDLREIVKEEKKKIKPFSLGNIKQGAKGSLSLYRLGAYLFLFLGFVALRNNHLLDIRLYLAALLPGIIAGYLFIKEK